MKAIVCTAFGDESNLVYENFPAPRLGPHQVRIAVKAAGVNFVDTVIIGGAYQGKLELPFVPGVEVAGVVTEIADGVATCRPGDRVLAIVAVGGYAEEVVTDAVSVIVIPDSMEWVDAAGFAGSWTAAYHGLTARGRLKPGETLLVHGAGSGTGLAAVAVGHQAGAKVIAVAGNADKLALAKEQGADLLIDHSREDVRTRAKELTGGRGVDVVFDPVGGKMVDASLRCVAPGGRILVIGFASGTVPQIPANIVLVKNCDIVGYTWGGHWAHDPLPLRDALYTLLDWYDRGKIRSHVTSCMPLSDTAKAISLLKQRAVLGKQVVIVDPSVPVRPAP